MRTAAEEGIEPVCCCISLHLNYQTDSYDRCMINTPSSPDGPLPDGAGSDMKCCLQQAFLRLEGMTSCVIGGGKWLR